MKYLKIKNDGVLDIRLVALMGGTTKSKKEYKIGQFGTGLKYTLAYLVRNNIDFKIFCGLAEVKITVETENISGEDFNIICINGQRTSITDKMGCEWQAWMIIRELWCNAIDEGGNEKSVVEHIESGGINETVFYIQLTPEVKAVLDDWNSYFTHDIEPIWSNDHHAIYPGGEDFKVYKQGVLIKRITGKKSLYNYDMKYAEINELREYHGPIGQVVFKCLKDTDSKTITHFLENVTNKHYEGSDYIDYDWFENFGKLWKETIGHGKLIHQEAVDNIKSRGIDIDTTGLVNVPKVVYKALTKQIKGIGALRVSDKMKEFYESYNSQAEERVKQALVIMEEVGYNFSPELKFVYGVFGDKTVNAQVNLDSKEVLLSENILDRSLFDLVAILIEESEHFKTSLPDCSRQFQQHWINLYTNQLLKNAKISI